MAHFDPSSRGSFGSRFGVIAAAAGSAIGLGNIWRFPYVAGENGGGAFLIVYLIFIVLLGIPVMLSEFTIGRMAQRNPYGAFKKLAPGKSWCLIGLMGVAAAFMILAFYSAVAGWTLEYISNSVVNAFAGQSPQELQQMFESFKEGTFWPQFWQLLFLALTATIVLAGVEKGIEKYSKILMPLLLVIIMVLCIRSITLPGSAAGLKFLFQPDFSKIDANVVLEALGQAFFSLSVGMGTLITYGSYIRKKEDLGLSALTVSAADTLIAILAGVAIFPAVFAFQINPAAGEELVFITLPQIFQQMPGGSFFSLIFFLLLAVAALTSSISVLEVVVAYFVEELHLTRKKATILATATIAVLGLLCSLSMGALPQLSFLGKNVFGWLDFLSANILLPLGGLFIVIFVGWVLRKSRVRPELTNNGVLSARYLRIFLFIVKFIAPLAIAMVFLNGLGILDF